MTKEKILNERKGINKVDKESWKGNICVSKLGTIFL